MFDIEIVELKYSNAEILKVNGKYNEKHNVENAKLKIRIEDLKKNKKDFLVKNVRRDVEITKIKAEIVKLKNNNEKSKQLTSYQSEVISKEMISKYDQNTIDEIES